MPELSKEDSSQEQPTSGEGHNQGSPGFGAILRSEREKQGLTREEVAQIIKLRVHFLEALENEEWNELPPSVFVKGFISSYARVLGLDEKRLLDLYEGAAPVESTPPKPLEGLEKVGRPRFGLVALVLVSLLVIIYLGKATLYPNGSSTQVKENHVTEKQKGENQAAQESESDKKEREPEKGQEELPVISNGDVEDVEEGKTDHFGPLQPIAEEEAAGTDGDETSTVESTRESVVEEAGLVLRGMVNERTWIRIYVDDNEPREFIFQPGSSPQWKAKNGFYVLVGNAAGIEFDFNGERVGNLGKLGQVVRLRLPETFDLATPEE